MTPLIRTVLIAAPLLLSCIESSVAADEPQLKDRLIGYTELRMNLPGGRHANVRTMRAVTVKGNGSDRRPIARGEQSWNLQWVYGETPLIPRSEPGRFDCLWIQPAPNIVTWNDHHWLYYVGLATIRRDGFVSINSGPNGGTFTTRPLKFDGNRLNLNAVTTVTGSVRVEIQNAAGQPHPGFTLADCTPLSGDNLSGAIRWKDNLDVSILARRTVQLRFVLKDADVYSIRFNTPKS